MAQQTAVDFLYEFVQLKLTHEQQMQFEGLFQQAKQIEKEQIVKAHGLKYYDLNEEVITGEQYYKETFTLTL